MTERIDQNQIGDIIREQMLHQHRVDCQGELLFYWAIGNPKQTVSLLLRQVYKDIPVKMIRGVMPGHDRFEDAQGYYVVYLLQTLSPNERRFNAEHAKGIIDVALSGVPIISQVAA